MAAFAGADAAAAKIRAAPVPRITRINGAGALGTPGHLVGDAEKRPLAAHLPDTRKVRRENLAPLFN